MFLFVIIQATVFVISDEKENNITRKKYIKWIMEKEKNCIIKNNKSK